MSHTHHALWLNNILFYFDEILSEKKIAKIVID